MPKNIIAWLLVVIWMVVIYKFSSESGEVSSGRSQIITGTIQSVLNKIPVKNKIVWTEHATRKTAHVMEYLILTALVINALSKKGSLGIRKVITAILISIAYAAFDEFHQSFSANRGPSVRDVLIDSIGVFLTVLLYKLKQFKFRRPAQKA